MRHLTAFSLRSPAVIFLAVILLFAGGIYSATKLPLEAMPDIEIPVVTITAVYPGADPERVAEEVTEPLELAVRSVEGMKDQVTTSSQNVSLVVLEFEYGADMDEVQDQVEKAVKTVSLPAEVELPNVGRYSFDAVPILRMSVGAGGGFDDLDEYVRKEIVPELQSVDGVAGIELAAQKDSNVKIRLLPSKLKKYNLTVEQVTGLLVGNNMVLPAGELELEGKVMPVTVGKGLSSVKAFKDMPIPVFPTQADSMKYALTPIADGMKNLGGAVGALGRAVGQIGGALGQMGTEFGKGMAGLAQGIGGVQGQVQLLGAIGDLQSAIFDDKMALLQSTDPAEQAGLQAKIAAEEAALAKMKAQLKGIQDAMAAASEQSASSGGSGSARRGGGGSSTFKTTKTKRTKPKVKLIRLSQIADISVGATGEKALSRLNGSPAVSLGVLKEPESNTVEVSEAVQERLAELVEAAPHELSTQVIQDQAVSVRDSVDGLIKEGLLGALLAASVILIFLRHWRSTIIACVSIPLSLLVALIVLKWMGVSLNIMTLGGLAVAIGRIVDDSIVVIENIYRHHQKQDIEAGELVQKGTEEVAGAITSSSLTTVGAFVPLALVSGFIGEIFVPFAAAVVSSLLASLIIAVTVVPLLAKLLLRGDKGGKDPGLWIASAYRWMLEWSLDHKLIVVAIAFLALFGGLTLAGKVGSNFLPREDTASLTVDIELPAGTAFETLDRKTRAVEALLMDRKGISEFLSTVGPPTNSMEALQRDQSVSRASIFINLKEGAPVERLVAELRKETDEIEKPGTMTVTELQAAGGGSSNPQLQIIVEGDDLARLETATAMVRETLVSQDGIANLNDNLEATKPGLSVVLRAKTAAKQGFTSAQIGNWMNDVLTGKKVTEIDISGDATEVNLGVKFKEVRRYEELRKLKLIAPTGKLVKLGDVAKITETKMPANITKRNGERYASIVADFAVQDTGRVSREVQAKLDALSLPKGTKASQFGDAQRMEEGFEQLGLAMIIAVSVVFLIMVITFGEARTPFAILFALPFTIIGTVAGLYLADQQINISSMIGGLMLIGIVVTNAIVLVYRVQQQRKSGLGMRDALLEAGTTRLRPVLMTAAATILALVPLAAGMSGGTLISQALAVTVIGGLTSATVATLVLTPVAMEILFRFGGGEAGKAERDRRRAANEERKLARASRAGRKALETDNEAGRLAADESDLSTP